MKATGEFKITYRGRNQERKYSKLSKAPLPLTRIKSWYLSLSNHSSFFHFLSFLPPSLLPHLRLQDPKRYR